MTGAIALRLGQFGNVTVGHADSDSKDGDMDVEALARKYRQKHETDVVFYNASIGGSGFWRLVSSCVDQNNPSRDVMVILLTYGGSAEWAYKMARFLQDYYRNFSIFVPRQCKSAGTILAIGANNIIMSPYGELGPLDVQVLKEDELLERRSGATVVSALEILKEKSLEMFEWFMVRIKARSGGAITLRTSTDISTSLVTGLFKEVFGQIDPNYLGEMNRNMLVAYEYGKRLAKFGENIEEDCIRRLVYDYPNHEFVIDRREAGELFHRVLDPDDDLRQIVAALGERCVAPLEQGYDVALLSTDTPDDNGETAPPGAHHGEGKNDRDDEAREAHPRRPREKNCPTDRGCIRGEGEKDSREEESSVADR